MKLSFSLSSPKNSSKPSKSTFNSSQHQHDESANKEFITEFDPSQTLADSNYNTNSKSKNPIIIPPIPNEWRPQNKISNINDPNPQFEPDSNSNSNSSITYGLNIRANKLSISDTESKGEHSESLSSIERLMLMKLRSDLQRLPDDRGLEEFDDMPVEEFAPALLKGYGWYEGRGIGKNAKEDVKVIEFTKRTTKEGLGFV